MIRYKIIKPTLEQYKFLRDSADWNLEQKGISDERASRSLDSSPLCICTYDGDNIVGMVRLSGDLEMYGYIQDTIVLPDYQRKGIGKGMIQFIFDELKDKKGFLLGLCPSKTSVDFYERLGFIKRPEDPNGFMYMEIGRTIKNLKKGSANKWVTGK